MIWNYKSVSTIDDICLMQSDLHDLFERWFGNDVILNTKKCKTISFFRSNVTLSVVHPVSDVDLERVDSIEDIGAIFDRKMSKNW